MYIYSQEISLCNELLEEKEERYLKEEQIIIGLFTMHTIIFCYFYCLEGLSDTEHKEFTERLAENTRQFLSSQLRAKIVDSSIDSSTSSDNDS